MFLRSVLGVATAVALSSAAFAAAPGVFETYESSVRGASLRERAELSGLVGSQLPGRSSGGFGVMGGPDAWIHGTAIVGYAEHELTGQLQYSDGGQVGTRVDMTEDLGLRKTDTTRYGAQFRFFTLRFAASMQEYTLEGNGTVPFNINFGGVQFAGNTPIQTTIDVKSYTAEVGFTILSPGPFELGVGLGIHYNDVNMRMAGNEPISNNPVSRERDFQAPIPVVALYGGLFLGPIGIEPTLHVMQLPEYDGVKGELYDLSIIGKWYIIPNLGVGVEVGYTLMNIEATDDPNSNDSLNGNLDLESMRISLVVGVSF